MADTLTEKLHLTVANARVKWMFGTQSRSWLVPSSDGSSYVAPNLRAPEKWYIYCVSVRLDNSDPPQMIVETMPQVPVVEVPNTDEWWDTNAGWATNKKDIKFIDIRSSTPTAITHIAFYDSTELVTGGPKGRMWELASLKSPFTIGVGQTAVIRANDLFIFGFNPFSLVQF